MKQWRKFRWWWFCFGKPDYCYKHGFIDNKSHTVYDGWTWECLGCKEEAMTNYQTQEDRKYKKAKELMEAARDVEDPVDEAIRKIKEL